MNNDLEIKRHSLSHILAAAVAEMFPEAKLGIGPAVENGFYYDFDLPRTLIPEDLPLIEEKMRKMIDADLEFKKVSVPIAKALERLEKNGGEYKKDLVAELKKEGAKTVSLYKTGNYVDLCKGPHVKSTSKLKNIAFVLDKISGAYWRGDEKNKMLQRIYGLAFVSKAELGAFLKNREEAEKRDHRSLGEKLELFTISDEVGAGLPLWLPRGVMLCRIIKNYMSQELTAAKYEMVETPHIARSALWKTSGHLDFYRENMYSPFKVEDQEFLVKPMNCPYHIQIYKNKLRSYRGLPIRFAEFGTVYRFEKSGVLHGLMRARGFTQDDAHIYCRQDQMQTEITNAARFAIKVLQKFGFSDYEIYLSTKPEKAVGSDESWQKATEALKLALKAENLKFEMDPGEGVFYGPKIDIKIKDSLGRAWQCTTIQVDFNLPAKFEMEYINENGKKIQPIMIHRALLGSLERFVGVLIEHYAGAFPVWLAPVQAIVLPISEKHSVYAEKIHSNLDKAGVRAELDKTNETVGKKIRSAELKKIPYMLIVGDKEIKSNKVSLRRFGDSGKGQFELKKLISEILTSK